MPVDLTRHIAPDTGAPGKTPTTKHTFRIDPSLISGVKPSTNVTSNVTNKSETEQKSAEQQDAANSEKRANDAVAKKIEAVEKRIAQLNESDTSTQVAIRRDSSSSIGMVERKPMLSFESSSAQVEKGKPRNAEVLSDSPKKAQSNETSSQVAPNSVVQPVQKSESITRKPSVIREDSNSGKVKESVGNQIEESKQKKENESRSNSRQNSETRANNIINNNSTPVTIVNSDNRNIVPSAGDKGNSNIEMEKLPPPPVPATTQAPVSVQEPQKQKTEGIVEEQIDVSSVIKRFNDKCNSLKKNSGVTQNAEPNKNHNLKQMYATMDSRGKRNAAMNRGYTVSEYSARAETFRRQASMQAQHCAHCKPGGHCKVRSKSQGATEEDIVYTETTAKSNVINFRVRFDETSFRASEIKATHHHHHHHHHQKRRPASAASSDQEEDLFEKYETLV